MSNFTNNSYFLDEREFAERPKHKVLSRGTEVDRAKVIDRTDGNQFYAVMAAARATRNILQERRRSEIDPFVSGIDGLKAIESGEVDFRDLISVPDEEFKRKLQQQKLPSDYWSL